MFSIDNSGNIVLKSILENIPISGSLLTKKFLTSNECGVCLLEDDIVKQCGVYDIMKEKGLNKIYYKNVFKDKDAPTGFIIFSYKDKNYILDKDDKIEIARILNCLDINISLETHESDLIVNEKKKTFRNWLNNVFFISTLALLFLIFSNTYSTDIIYSKNFETYVGVGNMRGHSDQTIVDYDIGLQEYNNGEYENALNMFEKYLTNNSDNNSAIFYAGCSALSIDDVDKALFYFNFVDSESAYIEETEWYIIGCYLKKNDIEKIKTLLTKILNESKHDHYEDALNISQNKLFR